MEHPLHGLYCAQSSQHRAEQDDGVVCLAQLPEGLLAVRGFCPLEPLLGEQMQELRARGLLTVHDQDLLASHSGPSAQFPTANAYQV